jgi:hypothetical protein
MGARALGHVSLLMSLCWAGCTSDGSRAPMDGGAADGQPDTGKGLSDGRVSSDSRVPNKVPGDARAVADGARGDAATRDAAPVSDSAAAAAVPRVTSDFWTVAHNPDLGAVGAPGQQVVDFSVWEAADGTWQLWSCIRGTNVGGNTRLFYHWEGRNLTDSDWTPKGIAMQADPSLGETAGGVQAPFVLRMGDTWHMFYGDWEHICHATSTDGKAFTRVVGADGKTGLFTEGIGLNTRDPMLLHEGTTNYLYYATSDGADYVRTSTDLASFGASTRVAYGGSAGTGGASAECPFVVRPDPSGPYFLFRTQLYGGGATTRVYRSLDPKNFGMDDDAHHLVATLPLAAPEIVRVGADYYIAALRGDLAGIQIAHLAFTP